VRAKIVDSAKRGAANICYIGKTRDKASGDFGRNPLWAGAVLACCLIRDVMPRLSLIPGLISFFAETVTAQRVFHRVRGS
jgi:hypothetical protein